MNQKRSAIYRLTYLAPDAQVNHRIGRSTVTIPASAGGIVLPVSATELSERKDDSGNFVEVELSARITDTSAASEDRLLSSAFRYGMFILDYTDGTRRLLGTPQAPVLMTYSKSGVHSAFELSIKGVTPEFSKQILNK